MNNVLWLLALQGVLGALDTLYYHEWRARLPARAAFAHTELQLHAARDFLYAIMFSTLPWLAWQGWWTMVLAALLMAEIVITLADFIVEDHVRQPLGGVYPGERAMHAVMGIVYGAMLAQMIPILWAWWSAPTGLVVAPPQVPEAWRWVLAAMAVGVFLSGVRDLCAACAVPHSAWPWRLADQQPLRARG